jgi:hypothetical protein
VEGRLITTANAFQGDVYLRTVDIEDGVLADPGRDEVLPAEGFLRRVEEEADGGPLPVTVLGFGCGILLSAGLPATVAVIQNAGVPSARGLLSVLEALGPEQFRAGPERLRPVYLRPSAAEMKNRKS